MSKKFKSIEAETITHDASALILPEKNTLSDPSEVLWDIITFGFDENGKAFIAKYEPSLKFIGVEDA